MTGAALLLALSAQFYSELPQFQRLSFNLPLRPLLTSPIGISDFVSRYGLRVLASEVLWVWLPLGLLLATQRGWLAWRRRGRPPSSPGDRIGAA